MRLGRVRGAAGLEEALRAMVLEGSLRTYVMDMGGAGLPRSRYAGITVRARHAGARGVYVLECEGEGVEPCEFYLDRSAGRFCLLHAHGGRGEDVDEAVRMVATTTWLRRACPGPAALEAIAFGASGKNGRRATPRESIRTERAAEDGVAAATMRWDGAVISAGGTSARAHLRLADEARDAYARMCSRIEGCKYGFPVTIRGVRRHVARSVGFVLSRPIGDVPGFVGDVLDGGPPLRMKGTCSRIEDDHYFVPVIDLENAESLGMSITSKYLSMVISNDWPGASVLRLLGHMQLYHDHGLTCPIAAGTHDGQTHVSCEQVTGSL